MIFLRR